MRNQIEKSNVASKRQVAPFVAKLAEIPEAVIWLANFDSARTRQTYSNAVTDCMAFLEIKAPEELYGLEQTNLIAWRHDLKARGIKPRTINNRLSALSSLFKHLLENQIISSNPAVSVKRSKVTSHCVVTPALSRDQVRALLDVPDVSTLSGARDSALFHMFAYTGCRISEPTRLRVCDFHLDQDCWVIDFIVRGGKENRIAIHTELQVALRHYLAMAGHHNDPDAYIFQRVSRWKDYDGAPIKRRMIDKIFKKYARGIGLEPCFTVHSFRAAFITEALEHGHPVEAVQKSVAHASMNTTLAYDRRDYSPRKSASFAVNY